MTLASSAFRLALRGCAVFPLSRGSKLPIRGSRGFYEASRDADVVRERWRRYPSANIGVGTGRASRLWALDIDPPVGFSTLENLIREHGKLPKTVAVVTPSYGVHFWWRWPDVEIRCSASRIGPGIDVRGEGGYVIAPPSRLAGGGGWAWVKDATRDQIRDAPDWLVALAAPPPATAPAREPIARPNNLDAYVSAAVDRELSILQMTGEGARNHQLNACAFSLFGFAKAGLVPEDWLHQQLRKVASDIGLSQREIERTLLSAWQAAPVRIIENV